jgi:hypothetical protein
MAVLFTEKQGDPSGRPYMSGSDDPMEIALGIPENPPDLEIDSFPAPC